MGAQGNFLVFRGRAMTAWVRLPVDEGKVYYWNPASSKTEWQLPPGDVCAWQAYTEAEGRMYYHNLLTGQTVWTLPVDDSTAPEPKVAAESAIPGLDDDWLRSY